GALRVRRVVELPPLIDHAVAVTVALASGEAPALVVVPGVDLAVVVGLALLADHDAVLEVADLVDAPTPIVVGLAPPLAPLGVVVDVDVDAPVEVEVHRPTDLAAAVHHADDV